MQSLKISIDDIGFHPTQDLYYQYMNSVEPPAMVIAENSFFRLIGTIKHVLAFYTDMFEAEPDLTEEELIELGLLEERTLEEGMRYSQRAFIARYLREGFFDTEEAVNGFCALSDALNAIESIETLMHYGLMEIEDPYEMLGVDDLRPDDYSLVELAEYEVTIVKDDDDEDFDLSNTNYHDSI